MPNPLFFIFISNLYGKSPLFSVMNGLMNIQIDGQVDKQADRGQINRQIDTWMDGWMYGWMDKEKKDRQPDIKTCL